MRLSTCDDDGEVIKNMLKIIIKKPKTYETENFLEIKYLYLDQCSNMKYNSRKTKTRTRLFGKYISEGKLRRLSRDFRAQFPAPVPNSG